AVGQSAKLVLQRFHFENWRAAALRRCRSAYPIPRHPGCNDVHDIRGNAWRIARHASLHRPLMIPERTRMVPVARTGNYEIRMLRLPEHCSNSEPAIWMELFDLGTQLPVDSIRCSGAEDALAVFKEFVTQAKSL